MIFLPILYMNVLTGINYWLKAELLKLTEPGDYNQFWLGAKTHVSQLEILLDFK
jgi:hypothetical protein